MEGAEVLSEISPREEELKREKSLLKKSISEDFETLECGLLTPEASLADKPVCSSKNEVGKRKKIYVSIVNKFFIALFGALFWVGISVYFALPWFSDLSNIMGVVLGPLVIFGIAIIPGFMNAFLIISLLLDRRPVHPVFDHYPDLSILIAAYNEESAIVDTIRSISLQEYPGKLYVIVINDGSKDKTAELVKKEMVDFKWLSLMDLERNVGKANALNKGLPSCLAEVVITIDADSYLYAGALQRIVERYLADPKTTKAVAGTVLVRNSRKNWITKAQEWDYFHGISAIKRVQSMYQATLVAQGAFSLYDKKTLLEVGG